MLGDRKECLINFIRWSKKYDIYNADAHNGGRYDTLMFYTIPGIKIKKRIQSR